MIDKRLKAKKVTGKQKSEGKGKFAIYVLKRGVQGCISVLGERYEKIRGDPTEDDNEEKQRTTKSGVYGRGRGTV
jgi:hypothetical protein